MDSGEQRGRGPGRNTTKDQLRGEIRGRRGENGVNAGAAWSRIPNCVGAERGRHLRGILLTATGVLILTPDALLIRLIQADTWTLLFWRGLFQFAALAVFFLVRDGRAVGKRLTSLGRWGFVTALFYAAANTFFVNAVRLTTAANTLVIISASPLLAALFSRVFLGEHVKPRTWAAAVAGLAGIAVIFVGGLGGGSLAGNVCAVFGACFLAGSFVVIRGARALNLVPAVALSGLLITLFNAPGARPLSLTGSDVGWLILLGMLVIPVSWGLITLGPRYLPAPEVNLLMLLETVLGPVWVWRVVGEVPAPSTFLGGLIVIGAVAVHSALALREGRAAAPLH